MKFKFSRIPELEYEIVLNQNFCLEVSITEDGMNCEILSKTKFKNLLGTIITKACNNEIKIIEALDELLKEREKVLKTIKKYAPRIYPFIDEEEKDETKKEIELETKEKDEEIQKEVPLDHLGEEAHEEEHCIEVISKNTDEFKKSIENYLETYTKICELLLESSTKSRDNTLELISQLANLDTVLVNKHDLSGSILIPLDICPQRLALALNKEAILNQNRSDAYYIPPVMARRIKGKNIVYHAYRSIDDYPVLFPAIHMKEQEIVGEREKRFRQEVSDATKILYRLKRGRRGARFPLSELSEIIAIYLEKFQPAKDKLALVDLGAGRGSLLKVIVDRFISEHASLLDDRSTWLIVLNDLHEAEKTGEEFVLYASTDRASQYIKEVRKIIGDIGAAVNLLKDFCADICFINRVLDMYARYGFYSVDLEEPDNVLPSAAVKQKKDTEGRGTVLVYGDLIRFKDIYNLQRQLLDHEELRKRTVIPGIYYNLKNYFFEPRKFSLEDLVNMSRLVVVSIFPATEDTLFAGLLNPQIHISPIGEHDLETKPRYLIFCLSKDKGIIDAIDKKFGAI